MLLPSKTELPDNVLNFCNSGKPPVYIGFGSNPIADTEKFKQIFKSQEQHETTPYHLKRMGRYTRKQFSGYIIRG